MAKRIRNSYKSEKNIKIQFQQVPKCKGLNIDVSFEGLYYSVTYKEFTNFLKDEKDFSEKFRLIRNLISKIACKDFQKDLLSDGGMRHCHVLEQDKAEIVKECIKKALKSFDDRKSYDEYIDNVLGGEKIYQIGFEDSVRLIGTYNEVTCIFRIYLIDYHHKLSYDEKRNAQNNKYLNYCPLRQKR